MPANRPRHSCFFHYIIAGGRYSSLFFVFFRFIPKKSALFLTFCFGWMFFPQKNFSDLFPPPAKPLRQAPQPCGKTRQKPAHSVRQRQIHAQKPDDLARCLKKAQTSLCCGECQNEGGNRREQREKQVEHGSRDAAEGEQRAQRFHSRENEAEQHAEDLQSHRPDGYWHCL